MKICKFTANERRRHNRETFMSVDMEGGNPHMDYEGHKGTYAFFGKLVKIGSAVVIAILVGMFIFLV